MQSSNIARVLTSKKNAEALLNGICLNHFKNMEYEKDFL